MRQFAPDETYEDVTERETARADRDAAALLLHTAALLREEAACDRNLAALFRHEASLERRAAARPRGQDQPQNGSAPPTTDLGQVVVLLQQAADAIDGLWNEARVMQSGEVRMALADASHGVHRALIALRKDPEF
jgi:hypothetical protein